MKTDLLAITSTPILLLQPKHGGPDELLLVSLAFPKHGRELAGEGGHGGEGGTVDAERTALLAAPCYVVLPQGEDGWYINAPGNPAAGYETYLEEVIAWAERTYPIARDPRARGIAGWSMGGYGALVFGGVAGFVTLAVWLWLARGITFDDGAEDQARDYSDDGAPYGPILMERRRHRWQIVEFGCELLEARFQDENNPNQADLDESLHALPNGQVHLHHLVIGENFEPMHLKFLGRYFFLKPEALLCEHEPVQTVNLDCVDHSSNPNRFPYKTLRFGGE